MGFGAQIWDGDGKSWIDVVDPSWVLDIRSKIHGDGVIKYAINTSLFKLNVVVVSDCNGEYIQKTEYSINGGEITYSAASESTFIVFMEAR